MVSRGNLRICLLYRIHSHDWSLESFRPFKSLCFFSTLAPTAPSSRWLIAGWSSDGFQLWGGFGNSTRCNYRTTNTFIFLGLFTACLYVCCFLPTPIGEILATSNVADILLVRDAPRSSASVFLRLAWAIMKVIVNHLSDLTKGAKLWKNWRLFDWIPLTSYQGHR